MDKFEIAVLSLVRSDSRMSVKDMATALKSDEAKVKIILENLEKSGVILGYTAVVDESKLGKDYVEALIEVKVAPKSAKGFDEIAADIERFDEVRSLYLMSGAYDLCIIIEGKTLREVAMFVSEKLSCLDSVLSTATHFILKKYTIDGTSVESAENERLVVQP